MDCGLELDVPAAGTRKRLRENPFIADLFEGYEPTLKKGLKTRHSALTWSTVTSATGLSTIEPEPSRSRSSSFWRKSTDDGGDEDDDVIQKPSSSSGDPKTGNVYRVVADGESFDLDALKSADEWRHLGRWDFPIFTAAAHSPNTLLTKIAYHAFASKELFHVFHIPLQKFFNFFHALEIGYWDIPYHNRIHASDVLHAVFYLTHHPVSAASQGSESGSPTSVSRVLSPLELMALFTAAAMHDFDHPGRTNAFLVATADPKAILYNDRSILENHHAAAAWKLFADPDNMFLGHLDAAELKRFRYLVIELILATDLKRHFEVLSEFGTKAKSAEGLEWEAESDKLLVSQMLLKVADINSPTKPFPLHIQWTERITEEFYVQGDEETRLSLPPSPYMSRADGQVPKLQDSFIAHLVAPLANAAADAGLLPLRRNADDEEEEESELIRNMHSNHAVWKEQLPQESAETSNANSHPEESSDLEEHKEGEMTTIEEREDEEDFAL